ncbi:MAG TPA: peptide-methionine (R)-S-oxide reductase MsrB [Candidatus Limnocylindrales bacterium]|nr:peptide-methionine (R)-S-oxide reductase MsrB [Candidatus Limnocylindrales bacterium]
MDPKQMTDDDWRQKLTPEQYRVLREQGTEVPGSGEHLYNNDAGDYICAGCGTVVFKSDAKYDSHTPGLIGWPSFSAAADNDAIELRDDNKLGMHRTEVVCKTCGGHLGHLFDDPSSPNGVHYCINSLSLDFKKQ